MIDLIVDRILATIFVVSMVGIAVFMSATRSAILFIWGLTKEWKLRVSGDR